MTILDLDEEMMGEASVEKGNGRSPLYADHVWLNGELVAFEQATVHLLTPTLHYGPGVFEGIRCYGTPHGPAVFRLGEHLERFLDGVAALGIDDLPYDVADLRRAVAQTVLANGFVECYIRPLLFFTGSMALNLDAYEPNLGIAAWKWGAYLGSNAPEEGIRLMVSSVPRWPGGELNRGKISGQYVNPVMAKTLALRAGYDEAVMLDGDGYVAECTGENLLLVRDGVVVTTPGSAILEGITRDTVLTLAGDAGYAVEEARIPCDDLFTADEVFICGTAAEVVPVRGIDDQMIGDGRMGPITRRLQSLYFETVHGRNQYAGRWLDYLAMGPVI